MNLPPIHPLVEMLEFARPAWSVFEEAFIDKYIRSLSPAPREDSFGNLILDIGNPQIVWSSHTDTVHQKTGLQLVTVDKNNIARLSKKSQSSCLGADCTTGVYIMLKMIAAGIEGRYIFHREEESGGKGSKWIAANTPDVVKGMQACIAFDRKGNEDIIITQGGDATASRKFAESLASILMMGHKPSTFGSFTDSKSYMALIPECTNIAVGYQGAHSSSESQDLTYVDTLVEKMVNFDASSLVIERNPAAPVVYNYQRSMPYQGGGGMGFGYGGAGQNSPMVNKKLVSMHELVAKYPTSTGRVLRYLGFTMESLEDVLVDISMNFKDNGPHDIEDFIPMWLQKVVPIQAKPRRAYRSGNRRLQAGR